MKLTENVILTLALSALSLTAFAYDDPQTDHDSLYSTELDVEQNNREVVDIAVIEIVSRTNNTSERIVDPQTDYDSVYMTDYLESLEP